MLVRKFTFFTLLACGILLTNTIAAGSISTQSAANSSAQDANSPLDHSFFVILNSSGQRIGFQTESLERDAKGNEIATRITEFSFVIDGHGPISSTSHSAITYDEKGLPLRYFAEHSTGNSNVEYTAIFDGSLAQITRISGEEKRIYHQKFASIIPIQDPSSLTNGPSGEFLSFDPALGRFVRQSVQMAQQPDDSQFSGEVRIIFRDDYPVDLRIIERDEEGNILSAILPQPGSPYRYEPVQHPPSLGRARQGGSTQHPMLPSPHSISSRAKKGHIRYRITLSPALASLLPQTAQQTVKLTPEGAQIDVCSNCGVALPDDPKQLEIWTRPTPWLQSDFAPIARRGARVGERAISDRQKLEQLARITRKRMSGFNFNGHSSARTAWQRRAGDCTEDAVLLAAMARAADIPTLVVSGLAYSRERYHGATHAFIPHAWVVAYLDGEWVSYDMTLEEGFGASHIGLSLGEGEASQMVASNMIAGMLEWRSLSQVRRRPTSPPGTD